MEKSVRLTALLLATVTLTACASGSGASTGQTPEFSVSAAEPGASVVNPAQGASVSAEETVEPSRYTVYYGNKTYVFDENGSLVPPEEDYTSLRRRETNQELYRVYTRQEDTGADDERGNPIVAHLSALYDAEGNLLYDWEEIQYEQGVGTLLIRHDHRGMSLVALEPEEGYYTALWDPATGEDVLTDVGQISVVSEDVYLATSPTGAALGLIDGQGNILSGFPVPFTVYSPNVEHGFLAADTRDPYDLDPQKQTHRIYLLDQQFNVLLEGEFLNIGFQGLRGEYVLHGDGTVRSVFALSNLAVPLYTYDAEAVSLQYFDGERMILRTGERGQWQDVLCDGRGEPLTETYDSIRWNDADWHDKSPATQFAAKKGEEVLLLDRDGNVLRQATVPGATGFSLVRDGFVACDAEVPSADGSYMNYTVGLLSPDLEMLVPVGTYSSLNRAASYEMGETQYYDFWIGYKFGDGHGPSRRDVLDMEGNVSIRNLSAVGTISDDRLCVMRGFSMGLMDWKGNWIARHSIYQDLSYDD